MCDMHYVGLHHAIPNRECELDSDCGAGECDSDDTDHIFNLSDCWTLLLQDGNQIRMIEYI